MTLNYECPICEDNTLTVVIKKEMAVYHITELYCQNRCKLNHDHIVEVLNKATMEASELEE